METTDFSTKHAGLAANFVFSQRGKARISTGCSNGTNMKIDDVGIGRGARATV